MADRHQPLRDAIAQHGTYLSPDAARGFWRSCGPGPDTIAALLKDRDALNRAVEHAEYMAKVAECFMEATGAVQVADEEHDGTEEGESRLEAALERVGEAHGALRNRIYEFRKRRDCAMRVGGQPT